MANKSKEELAAEAQVKLDAELAAKLAEAANSGLVKVVANYDAREDTATLWGVNFYNEDGSYVAELSKEDAEAFVLAGRVTISN